MGFSLSAFAVVYEHSNTPADPGVLERVMERLKHRGPDGSDSILAGRVDFETIVDDASIRQQAGTLRFPVRGDRSNVEAIVGAAEVSIPVETAKVNNLMKTSSSCFFI